jgi:hypothetical protein
MFGTALFHQQGEHKMHYHHLSYISIKIDPLCNNTLLLATAKMLETFLEAIL